jgi:hypothetical protein
MSPECICNINDEVKRAVTGQTQAWVTSKNLKNSNIQKVFAQINVNNITKVTSQLLMNW